MDLPPMDRVLLILLVVVGSWIWLYVAGRLVSAGAIRTWWEFLKRQTGKNKEEGE